MFRVFNSAIGTSLLLFSVANSLPAQDKQVNFKLSGHTVSGNVFVNGGPASGMMLQGFFSTTISTDGTRAVMAQWSACSFFGGCPVQVAGLFPESAVVSGNGPNADTVQVNFNTANMTVVFFSTGPSGMEWHVYAV